MSLLIGLVWFFSGLGLYSMPYIFQNPKFMCYEGINQPQMITPYQALNNTYNIPTSQPFYLSHNHGFDHNNLLHKNKDLFEVEGNTSNYPEKVSKLEEQEGYECWESETACRRQIVVMSDRVNQMNLSLITQFSLFCSHYQYKILILAFFFAGGMAGLSLSQFFMSNRLGHALQIKMYLLAQTLNLFLMSYFELDIIKVCTHLFIAGMFGFAIWSVSQTYLRDICSREFFSDYRCAIFFLSTISQMSVTLLFTFISEWRKSIIYGVAIPLGILFILIVYFMIENPRYLIGRSNSNKVYKAFYDIFIFNDARRFFSARQFDIIYSKMIATQKQQSPSNQVQSGNIAEGQAARRLIPLSSPSSYSYSNLSPSQLNRNFNNQQNINFLSELNNNRLNTNEQNNNNRGNSIDINRLNTIDLNRINTGSSPFNNGQLSNINNVQNNQQQQQQFLVDGMNNQMNNNQQNGIFNHYQSQLISENLKQEDQMSRKSNTNPFQCQNTSNNLLFQNRLDLQSFNRNQMVDDKSMDKISLISIHNPTPEIMSNIFLKIPSNPQLNNNSNNNNNNQNKNLQQQFEDTHSQNSNNLNNQLNSSFQQKNNNFQITQQNNPPQQENLQTQMNINNVQTEYISRSQFNLQQNDNNNILITNMNNNQYYNNIHLTTNNNTYQAFTHYINIRDEGEEHKSQNESSSNVVIYRQNHNNNIENNVCEESENQQPVNEKLQYQEYLKRLIVYIIISSTFIGMYFLYMIEIDKIGINLSYNIFILGFSEFIGILFADKFIEFPDPRNTVKQCLFVSGVLSTSFIMLKQTKYCEASHIAVCPEKIIQLLFIGLVRFATIFGQSFLVRNFKLMEGNTQTKETTWKYIYSIGLIGVFIPLIILLITKSIYTTIFIYGIVAILSSQLFRN